MLRNDAWQREEGAVLHTMSKRPPPLEARAKSGASNELVLTRRAEASAAAGTDDSLDWLLIATHFLVIGLL